MQWAYNKLYTLFQCIMSIWNNYWYELFLTELKDTELGDCECVRSCVRAFVWGGVCIGSVIYELLMSGL
jgi:hypothetical protein